jgi:hypothetical protein
MKCPSVPCQSLREVTLAIFYIGFALFLQIGEVPQHLLFAEAGRRLDMPLVITSTSATSRGPIGAAGTPSEEDSQPT